MKTYFLSLFLLGNLFQNHAKEQAHFSISDSILIEDRLYNFSEKEYWIYKQGDDTTWANPQTSLDSWNNIDLTLNSNTMPPDWSGNAWFKTHLDVDSTMFGKKVVLSGFSFGAMEVFLNGVKVGESGKVGYDKSSEIVIFRIQPISIELDYLMHQQLTIRFSNFLSMPL